MPTHRRRACAIVALSVALVPTVFAATSGAASTASFVSPTDNIGCVMAGGSAAFARCDIEHKSWPKPARPKSCQLDYGDGVYVGASGRGRYMCAGDTALHVSKRRLAYGKSIVTGVMRCTSTASLMRCVNTRTKHGFELSVQRVRLF